MVRVFLLFYNDRTIFLERSNRLTDQINRLVVDPRSTVVFSFDRRHFTGTNRCSKRVRFAFFHENGKKFPINCIYLYGSGDRIQNEKSRQTPPLFLIGLSPLS